LKFELSDLLITKLVGSGVCSESSSKKAHGFNRVNVDTTVEDRSCSILTNTIRKHDEIR
jgi:hypothetical protein